MVKKLFSLVVVLIPFSLNAQTICGTANEGGSVLLTAPPGNVFTSIVFASYGTPNGSCGSFTIGGCHAANSVSISSSVFVGNNSASISATNGVFGDPCGGTPKRLYIEATYASSLPLTLVSFTAGPLGQGNVQLDWFSQNETNTSHFVIEKSTDGIVFLYSGTVQAKGSGASAYHFADKVVAGSANCYFRLKMIDRDGRFQYSPILRIKNETQSTALSVVPSLATDFITIGSNRQQDALIINSSGQLIKRVSLVNGNKFVDISSWHKGIYFIRSAEGTVKFVKQ